MAPVDVISGQKAEIRARPTATAQSSSSACGQNGMSNRIVRCVAA